VVRELGDGEAGAAMAERLLAGCACCGERRNEKWDGELVRQARGYAHRGRPCQDGHGAWQRAQATGNGWRHVAVVL